MIDFKQIQAKVIKYEKTIQLLQENLHKINKENNRLLEENQRLRFSTKQSKECISLKEDNQEIKKSLFNITGELHKISNTLEKVVANPTKQNHINNKEIKKVYVQPSII